MFPKHVHQIWFDFHKGERHHASGLHKENDDLIRDTREHVLRSGFGYTLWSLNEANEFIQTHYPYLKHVFTKPMKYNIVKCDLFRYLLMYHFGGMYVDLDFALIRDMGDIFDEQEHDIVLFEEWYNSCNMHSDTSEGSLHNGCILSKANQSFWLRLIMHIYSNESTITEKQNVWKVSGTNLLRNMFIKYKNTESIKVHSYVKMCPYICIMKTNGTCKECNRNEDVPLSLEESSWKFYDWKYVRANKKAFIDSYGVCVHVGAGSLW